MTDRRDDVHVEARERVQDPRDGVEPTGQHRPHRDDDAPAPRVALLEPGRRRSAGLVHRDGTDRHGGPGQWVGRVLQRFRARGQVAVAVPPREPGIRREAERRAQLAERRGREADPRAAPCRRLERHVRDAEPLRGDPGPLLRVIVDDEVRPPVACERQEGGRELRRDHPAEHPSPDHRRQPPSGQARCGPAPSRTPSGGRAVPPRCGADPPRGSRPRPTRPRGMRRRGRRRGRRSRAAAPGGRVRAPGSRRRRCACTHRTDGGTACP